MLEEEKCKCHKRIATKTYHRNIVHDFQSHIHVQSCRSAEVSVLDVHPHCACLHRTGLCPPCQVFHLRSLLKNQKTNSQLVLKSIFRPKLFRYKVNTANHLLILIVFWILSNNEIEECQRQVLSYLIVSYHKKNFKLNKEDSWRKHSRMIKVTFVIYDYNF